MTTTDLKRKLAAILSADVKGYSRLMSQDEVGTIRLLTAYKEAMAQLVQRYRGRVVDAPGDNVLAEFGSVADAVNCAVEIQRELGERNAELPYERQMLFRIGINLGDVVEEEGRIYGDGVNIAARMESVADGGGICISGTVHDHVKNKLGLEYESLGEQTVKNIPEPVRVYRLLSVPGAAAHRVVQAKAATEKRWRKVALAASMILGVCVAGVALWEYYLRPSRPKVEPASKEKMAFPLPDKPSIAVLPFVNMSGDTEQEYFSDGISEDLITDLSKVSGLFVIARNSSFTYKGKSVKIRQVAEELGVRYVLEGSVRRAGELVRINAQLIDATSGHHLWAERYDGSMKDVFALQDKINRKIVAALAVKLTEGEKVLVAQKGTNNPEAYDEFLKGREHALRLTREDFEKAEACYKRAIELDPKYAQARAALASLYYQRANLGLSKKGVGWLEDRLWARHYLREAMREPTSIGYSLAGNMDLFMRKHDAAISHLEKALYLDPNDPSILSGLGYALSMAGRPREGMEHLKKAMRLDPINPARHFFGIGIAHFCMGEWEEAATVLEKTMKASPGLFSPASGPLAAAYTHLGRHEKAKEVYENYRKVQAEQFPETPPSVAVLMYFYPFKERRIADSLAEGLIKAGLPGRLSDYIYVSKEDQLTGEKIRALFSGATSTGFDPLGQEWWLERPKDGKAIFRHPSVGSDTGRWWMEGETICSKFEKHYLGMEYCFAVFRNPNGRPERKDEYVAVGDQGMVRFSLVR